MCRSKYRSLGAPDLWVFYCPTVNRRPMSLCGLADTSGLRSVQTAAAADDACAANAANA
jgi:hypothetical protein